MHILLATDADWIVDEITAALGDDNRVCQRQQPDPETEFFWQRLQNLAEPGPKIRPEHLVYVAVRDTATLRAFVVDQLSARPEVALTETSLIFEHLPAAGATLA